MTIRDSDPASAEIVALDADAYEAAIPGLAALVVDGVEGGASVNFHAGVSVDEAEAGSPADAFYRTLGWRVLGTMPNHAYRSDGVLARTTCFWKDLRAPTPAP